MLKRSLHSSRPHSHGIVLVVALVLLLVVSIGSTVAVRLALNSSAIAVGLRGANEAQQAAAACRSVRCFRRA